MTVISLFTRILPPDRLESLIKTCSEPKHPNEDDIVRMNKISNTSAERRVLDILIDD